LDKDGLNLRLLIIRSRIMNGLSSNLSSPLDPNLVGTDPRLTLLNSARSLDIMQMKAPAEISTVLWNLSNRDERKELMLQFAPDSFTPGPPYSGKSITIPIDAPGSVTVQLDAPKAAERSWPVPGNGAPAVKGETGANGYTFSDGRYSATGEFRTQAGKPKAHHGIDLPAATGTPVGAAADGKVYRVGEITGFGNVVAIEHSDGYVTLYAHLNGLPALKPGDSVTRGQIIGEVGTTGNSGTRGDHLHFEVRVLNGDSTLARISRGGQAVDPTRWINGTLPER
jgi:murein DD-endopeptidase MepM/ murein hydrolase activator NlpD